MRLPVIYIAFCFLVLSGASYAKYYGLAWFGGGGPSGSRVGSFYYLGTSSSYHK